MVQFKVSPEMVALDYGEATVKSSDNLSSSSAEKARSVSSSSSSSTPISKSKKTTMTSDEKERHEADRTVLYSEIEEYKDKLGLLGVTVKEYGPAVMRLLGYLLNRKDKNLNKTQQKKESDGSREMSPMSVSEKSSKSELDVEQTELKKKKLSTRRFKNMFTEKKLGKQSNEKQQRDALVLYSLFKKLNISQNCINGTKLKQDIKENENKPNRYIFLFLKTINSKQYVVGFVSGSKTESSSAGEGGKEAKIDYVCPRLDQPPADTTKWRSTEMESNLVAYCILKMLWLNNDKGDKKYTNVVYDKRSYKTSKEVFDQLDNIKIDPYARQVMGFKRRSAVSASGSPQAES